MDLETLLRKTQGQEYVYHWDGRTNKQTHYQHGDNKISCYISVCHTRETGKNWERTTFRINGRLADRSSVAELLSKEPDTVHDRIEHRLSYGICDCNGATYRAIYDAIEVLKAIPAKVLKQYWDEENEIAINQDK